MASTAISSAIVLIVIGDFYWNSDKKEIMKLYSEMLLI